MVASSSWKPPHGGIGKSWAESACSWRGKTGTSGSSNWLHAEAISIGNMYEGIRLSIVAIRRQLDWPVVVLMGILPGLLAAIRAYHAYNLGPFALLDIASLSLVGSAYVPNVRHWSRLSSSMCHHVATSAKSPFRVWSPSNSTPGRGRGCTSAIRARGNLGSGRSWGEFSGTIILIGSRVGCGLG